MHKSRIWWKLGAPVTLWSLNVPLNSIYSHNLLLNFVRLPHNLSLATVLYPKWTLSYHYKNVDLDNFSMSVTKDNSTFCYSHNLFSNFPSDYFITCLWQRCSILRECMVTTTACTISIPSSLVRRRTTQRLEWPYGCWNRSPSMSCVWRASTTMSRTVVTRRSQWSRLRNLVSEGSSVANTTAKPCNWAPFDLRKTGAPRLGERSATLIPMVLLLSLYVQWDPF